MLASNFTGYLLPWDQLAYWAITVSTTLLAYIPLVGVGIRNLLLGGPAGGSGGAEQFLRPARGLHPLLLASISLLPLLESAQERRHLPAARRKEASIRARA